MSNETIGTIIAALISGICVAVPTIVATISSNKAHDQVVDEKMKNMSEQISHVDTKIDKFSSNQDEIKERLVIVENNRTQKMKGVTLWKKSIGKENSHQESSGFL